MAQLLTGTRIYGTATVDTQLFVSGTNPASSTVTGALQVIGGVGIGGAVYISQTSYISGSQIITTATVNQFVTQATQTTIFAGTDTAVNTSTGNVTVWNTSTLQTVTGRGSSTNNAVSITNTTASTSTNTGALTVTGGVGVGGNLYVSGLINGGAGLNITGSITATTFVGNLTGTATLALLATTATNIAAGLAGQLVYQSAPGTTGFVTTAATGYILSSNGSSAPSYVAQSTLSVGTATVATKWSTARTVSFSGDTTGTFTIDGSADVTGVNITIQPNSVALGTDTTGDYVSNGATAGFGISGSTTGETQTFTVTSNATSSNTLSTIVYRDTSGNFSAGTITASLTGTASKATNIVGGLAGSLPYQTAADTTAMLALGTSGYVLTAGASAPQWSAISGLSAGTATTATNVTVTNDVATNTPQYITFVSTSTGNTGIKTAAASGLTYIPSSGYHGIGIATPTSPLHLVASATSVIKFTGASTGQLGVLFSDLTKVSLTDSTSGEAFTITPGSNSLTLTTNATDRVTVDLNGQVKIIAGIAATSTSTGALVVNGGVGIGDKLYVGGLITGNAGATITGSVTATTFVGNLTGNASGTAGNISGGSAGSLPYQSGAATTTFLAIGTAGYFLTVNAGATAPQWTQTLGAANGGTGVNTLTGIAYGNGTSAFTAATGAQISTALGSTAITGNAANVSGVVATNNGGTGLSSWTAGDIAYYASGTALTKLALGTAGYILTAGATAPQWSLASGVSAGSATTATNIAGGLANQIPYQSAAGTTTFSGNFTWTNSISTLGVVGTINATAFTRTGNISSTAWTTTSPVFHSASAVLTDTSAAAGTVSGKVGASFFSPNFASTNAITVTDAINLYVQAPVASTNVTFTNSWGIYNTGNSFVNGNEKITTSLAVGTSSLSGTTGEILASGNMFLTGGSTQLNTGFTNKLNVSGGIVAGSSASTNGSIILQGQYGTGSITNFGTEYSSGGPVLSYGVYPSNAAVAAFFSSSGAALTRAAYTQNGNTHQWYTGASQTVAIGGAVTMTNPLTLNSSGLQALSLGVGTAPSGTTGEIRATNEITAYYSDRRLKENVKPIDNAVQKVLSLNGILYTPNDLARSFGYTSDKTIVGLFADEVDAVLPEAVRPAPFDQDENGNSKSGENYKTIQYEKLVPLLVEAIKEQQKQIAQLSETIDKLVNK